MTDIMNLQKALRNGLFAEDGFLLVKKESFFKKKF